MANRRASPVKRTSREGRSRPPLARMFAVHQALVKGGFPNCTKLAQELEVSNKTVQRDIDFMRDRLGLPIEYDQIHFGFFYTEEVHAFPALEVTEGEIVALFVGQKALAQYKGTSFEGPLKAAFEKMSRALSEKIAFRWSDLDAAFSFKGIGTTVSDLELFEKVGKAVLRSTELEFRYRRLGASGYENRLVQPLHLGCIEHAWYLFAYDLARKQMRTFALARMRDARDTRRKFKRPGKFSIGEHLGGSFGVFKSDGTHAISLRFDPFAAQLVSERKWHDSQKLKPLPGGGLQMTMKLGGLEEVVRWVLSWGEHVEVLSPPGLRDQVRKAADALLRAHGGAR